MRDFLTSHKQEIKFVYNLHCAGKEYIVPFNGEFPNTLPEKFPVISQIFYEIISEVEFAPGTKVGPSTENIGVIATGDAGDWIVSNLSIPAAEVEIGTDD